MNVLIAMDSFKESMTSLEAGEAAAEGIKRVFPMAEIKIIPMADGGEGTTEALVYGAGGYEEQAEVTDLLGRKRVCSYGVLPDGTAVIETAAAAGLDLLQPEERDPFRTTTYGLGEMIVTAIRKGCRKFIIGLGGSGTNDGGMGMLQALGFRFLDFDGKNVPGGAAGLQKLCALSLNEVMPELAQCTFEIACDVNNPLCGTNGCSYVFAPQKGANTALVREMDQWMANYAEIVRSALPSADPNYPGAGAAGGLGFAFLSFLNSKLVRGIDLVMQHCHVREHMEQADVVITGEGCMDGQTSMGKAPWGIATLAKELHKPVIALCGSVKEPERETIDACFSILSKPCSLAEAISYENAFKNLSDTAEQVFRLIRKLST